MNVGRLARNVGSPIPETTMAIDRPYPFGQKLAFGLLLLIVLPFHFLVSLLFHDGPDQFVCSS